MTPAESLESSFEDAERAQLQARVALDTGARIGFFEGMIELAYHGGALAPERLALRDQPGQAP